MNYYGNRRCPKRYCEDWPEEAYLEKDTGGAIQVSGRGSCQVRLALDGETPGGWTMEVAPLHRKHRQEETEPTAAEQMRADIDFLLVMAGVEGE